jgi:hypothetical protein
MIKIPGFVKLGQIIDDTKFSIFTFAFLERLLDVFTGGGRSPKN